MDLDKEYEAEVIDSGTTYPVVRVNFEEKLVYLKTGEQTYCRNGIESFSFNQVKIKEKSHV